MVTMLQYRVGIILGLTLLLGVILSPGPLPLSPEGMVSSASAGEQAPVAYAGNWSFIEPGKEVYLSALGSYDPDDDINDNGRIDGNETNTLQLYEWDFEGDGVYDWENASHGNVPHKYNEEGNFSATLRVTDADGNNATAVFWVFVYDDEAKEDDPEISENLFIFVAVGAIGFGVALTVLAYEIRRSYYSGENFAILSREDRKKAEKERQMADDLQQKMKKES